MKPRPSYRWKSFWLGLFVLVFLGWAWLDSAQKLSRVSFKGSFLANVGSGVCVGHVKWPTGLPVWNFGRQNLAGVGLESVEGLAIPPLMFVRNPEDRMVRKRLWSEMETMKAPATGILFLSILARDVGDWQLFVPHWLILLAVAALWLGWLFWHWKREQKKSS